MREIPAVKPGTEIPFEEPKARNFRDLGGYVGADGRRVKYGLLYRGGPLGLLCHAEKDRSWLMDVGFRTIFDFRADGEAAVLPEPVIPGAEYIRMGAMLFPDGTVADFSPANQKNINRKLTEIGEDCDAPTEREREQIRFKRLYTDMPFHNQAFRLLFERLLGGQVPLFFHCSAGKDRTGIAAILILLVLGVSEEDALADYMLTNVWRKPIMDAWLTDHPEMPLEERRLRSGWEGVRLDLAEDTLTEIKRRYGTYDAFFLGEFDIGPAEIDQLRRTYLEPEAE